jgi:hypothetical protein
MAGLLHHMWSGAIGPSIDLAVLDEISVETRGRAEATNSAPQQ